MPLKTLKESVVVITGAARGIGRGLAEQCRMQGARVVLSDIDEAPLSEAVHALGGAGGGIAGMVCDVTKSANVEALRDFALKTFGRVDVIVNNAGVINRGVPMWELSEAEWAHAINVNLWGVVHGIRHFVPLLVKQNAGHVVNVSSAAGLSPPILGGAYAASKAAVITLSECLRHELTLGNHSVSVTVVCPAYVQTSIGEALSKPVAGAPEGTFDEEPPSTPFLRYLVDNGMSSDQVARSILRAILEEQFILSPIGYRQRIAQERLGALVAGRAPSAMSFAALRKFAKEGDLD